MLAQTRLRQGVAAANRQVGVGDGKGVDQVGALLPVMGPLPAVACCRVGL